MRKIFIRINLNSNQFNKNKEECLTREWIEKRLDIFMQSNYKSLIAQKNQGFIAKIIYVDSTEKIIFDIMNKYEKLPPNIIFQKKSDDFISARELKGIDEIFILRLDSDDMYRNNVIDDLSRIKIREGQQAVLFQDGYLYDSVKKRIRECHHESPPFYALIYSTEEYLNGKRYNTHGGHKDIVSFDKEIIKGNNFIWHVHDSNTMNQFFRLSRDFGKGKLIIKGTQVNSVLRQFGIKI